MKLAKIRKTTAKGSRLNHAFYASKNDCLYDLVLWQEFTMAKGNYIEHLYKSGYFKDASYKNKLLSIINKLRKEL